MKHDQLCAIAHNMADSMASGMGFMIGLYATDVFGDAASSREGVIEVDFLNGRIVRGEPSDSLKAAAARFAQFLPDFCRENGAEAKDFAALSAVFETTDLERRVQLNVADRNGRSTTTDYAGVPLRRLRVLDDLGRIRRLPRRANPQCQ